MATIEEILQVEAIEKDIYRGPSFPSHLRRTFGGQVAGQALMSATRTVSDTYGVHSLHGYFLRPGNPDEPTVFLVDRIRDGRSFTTRRVTGIQDGEAIFMMSASFHVLTDHGIQHQDRMPPAPAPDELPDRLNELTDEAKAVFKEWQEFDLRVVPPEQMATSDYFAAQQRVWIRHRRRLPDDQVFHVGTLAYMSDMTLLGSSKVPHPGVEPQAASLDHAMWFMRPFRADEWLLYDQTSPSADAGRALTQGRIFDLDGRMVAAVTQEGLSRTGRPMPTDQHARQDR
ncbi:acyl-CoA thioesterase [Gordonia rhizosphera]|uniref:Acyl-CoA thioesterase 2 n=1 Tax=Gordonia rhizosphera NBRC 16068 TaxID=1108045 RepID=K6X214_9ACTN|nr:acyl-CoA thioesterase II [Gordonia rhizosphera]GAB92804.1 acyl-CoA thioesterase [Gordonia rhizosphera NBRC 16068]